MRVRGSCLVLALLLAAGACSEDPAVTITRQVIQDLVAQDYGRASTRYRQNEEEVISVRAAPLWRAALDHQDSTVREWAVDTLSRIGQPEDVDRVVAMLDDPSRGVRQRAREGLGRLDPERAGEEFRARLRSERPDQVVLAAEGLAELGADDAAHLILDRLADPGLPAATRGALTQPLITLADPTAAEPLADLALDPGEDVALRRLAAEAVVTLEGPGVREQIARLVDADDEYVASLAREALRSSGAP